MKGILKIFIMLLSSLLVLPAKAQQARLLPVSINLSEIAQPSVQKAIKSVKTPVFRELTRQPVQYGNALLVSRNGLFSPANTYPVGGIAPDFILKHWGVFCIGEYRLQQKTGLPLRFRIGSLDYVNQLEGK